MIGSFGVDRSARHLLRTCPQTLEDLTDARLLFEAGMVRLAVKRGGEGDIARLAEALEQLRRCAGDPKALVDADMAFHSVIASFSGNPIYTALSEFLSSAGSSSTIRTWSARPALRISQ